MNKELTIIMPTYNDSFDKINRTLQSIVSQKEYDFSKIEVIIVDDCSTKGQINWNELLNRYHSLNINYMKLPENKGPGVARQTALNIATGDFIFFLDCGDTLFDDFVLKEFNNNKNLDCDIISTKIYDVDSGNKRRSFLFNNAYIFGIFIKKQFLTEHNINFSEILRWEEDAFFEEQLRYYYPKVVSTKTVGYTYNDDSDSITRKNDHEYQNEFSGFSAMVIKSILLCEFYKRQQDYERIIHEVCQILSVCYSRFYDSIFKTQDVTERISKIMYLLRCLIENVGLKVDSEKFISIFIKNMYRKNYIYQAYGKEQIPYDKIHDFILLISTYNNLFDDYHIEGTNVTVSELLNIINNKNSELKKH